MAIYEDENGLRIESDQELNEDELTQAFGKYSKEAQSSGAGQQQPVKTAGESAKNVPAEPVKPVDVQDYLSNVAPMTDMSRPGKEDTAKFSPTDLVKDTGLALGKGIVGVPEFLVGIIDTISGLSPEAISRKVTESVTGSKMPRPDSLGKTLEKAGIRFKDARRELDYLMSPNQQAINQGMQDVKGFMNSLEYGVTHPSMILQMVAESAPSMLGGAAIGRGMLKAFPALAPYVAAAIGEGAVSGGQTAEQTRQRIAGGNLNTSQTAIAALSGALTGILGVVGGNLARRLNIVDIDTLLVGGGIKAAVNNEAALAKKGVIRKALESMVEEGVFQEFPQSMQEQMAQNVMEGKPIMEGAIEAGVQGLLTGGVMGLAGGGGGHVMQRYGIHRAQNRLSREMNTNLEAGNIRIINPEAPAQRAQIPLAMQDVEAPVLNIEQKEEGTSVAVENGTEAGSYDAVNDVLTISPDYQGDRVELAKQLLKNGPSGVSQAGEGTVNPQMQENVTAGQIEEQQGAFVETIRNTLSDKGSIDLTPIVDLGRTVYQQGANTFEKFSARIQELVGDAWEKVKDFVRQAWDIISGERGSIDFGKKDDKIKNAIEQTTGEAGPESITTMEGAEKDAISAGYNQAETQAVTELKQSQSFEEFERVIFGDVAKYGDTFNEAPLEKFMSKEELREYRATGKLNTRIQDLMIQRDNLKNMLGKAKTLADDMFRAGQKIGAIEQLERVREIQALQKEKKADATEFKNLSNWLSGMDKTIDKKKTIELEHRKVIKEVLAKNADALEVFLLKNAQTGDIFNIPQEQIELLRESRWESTNLVLSDLRNQVSIIKQLINQGRAAKSISIANEKFEFMEAIKEVSTNIRDLFRVPLGDWNEYLKTHYFTNTDRDIGGLRKEMRHYQRSFMSYLRKGEYIIENLCGYDRMALLYRATFGKTTDSENTKYRLNNEVAPLIESAFKEIKEEWQSGEWENIMTVQTPTGPLEITRHRAVAIGLNSGCEDNRRAMREGIREDRTSDQPSMLTDEAIDAIVAALNPSEKRFINKVWAIFAHQLPNLQKAYKEMFGEDMVIVDGIYYPMFFDRDLSNRIANAQANQDLFQQMGTVINVNRGRTITRVGGTEAIDLDVLRFLSAIEETNHFIAYGKMVRDVNRVISNKAVQDAVKDAIGEEFNGALKEWLRRIANPTYSYQGDMKRLDKSLGWLRKNAITAILGWGLSTAAVQFSAIGMTVHRLGFAQTMKGFYEFYFQEGWSEISEWALKASPWLAERVGHTGDLSMAEAIMGTNVRELSNKKAMKKIMADPKSAEELTKRSFFALICLTDKMITLPTWYTAYQMEFAKSKDHDKAVEFADHETRQSQASTTAKDTATVMAGGNVRKSFTMFQSFFSQQFNEMVRDVDLVKHGKIGYIDLMRSYFWMLMIPAIIQAIVKARGWSDDKDKDKKKLAGKIGKDVAKELLGNTASSIPLLGGVVNSLTDGFDFRPTPVINVVQSGVKATQSAAKAIKTNRAFYGKNMPPWMREGGIAIGYLGRLPSRQIMRTADEAWDAYHKGRVSWKNAYGMIYKERKKEK